VDPKRYRHQGTVRAYVLLPCPQKLFLGLTPTAADSRFPNKHVREVPGHRTKYPPRMPILPSHLEAFYKC